MRSKVSLILLALLLAATAHAEEAPPTLELEGTPEVPAELADRLSRYLEGRSAWLRGISDDGTSMLISTRFGSTYQVHEVAQPMGMRRQLTFGDEPVRAASYVPGSRDLLTMSDIGGDEQYQWFVTEAGGARRMLTDGTSRHGGGLWSHDGTKLAFSNNARNGKDMDVRVLSMETGASSLIAEAEGHWSPMAWSPDDAWLLVGHYVSTTDRRLILVSADGSEVRRLTSAKKPQAWSSAVFHPDGDALYLTLDKDGEFTRLYTVGLTPRGFSRKAWTPMTDDIDWNVGGLRMSPDGATLAFTVNADGWSELWLLDVATGNKKRVEVEESIIAGLQWARDARVLAFTRTGPTSTGDVWTFAPDTNTLTQWTQSEMGGLDPESLIGPELVRFASFDGLSVPAWVYRPVGDGPHPVIINIHGGPEGQARPYYSSRIQSWLAAGFAVVVPNVRGSSGYGRTYVSLDNGFQREDSVKDIGALLDWIAQDPGLNADRVGVSGGSYGGYMVLACLMHYSDRIRAGVDVVGISNFVTFLENTKAYRRDLRRVEYGDERDPKMRAHLEAISPTTNVDKIQSALFVAHGANDPRVPVGEARQIVHAVRSAGHDVWSMVAHDEGHGFRKRHNRDLYAQLTLLFFEKHLMGSETE